MNKLGLVLALVVFSCLAVFAQARIHRFRKLGQYEPRLLSTIDVKLPGFTTFIPAGNDASIHHLAVSSFDGVPLSPDNVYYFANFTGSTYSAQILNNENLEWPNEISFSNISLINNTVDPYGGLIAPAGFLVPTKNNGGLFYYPFKSQDRSLATTSAPILLSGSTQSGTKWFYHRVKVIDVSGDGVEDLLTCRSYKPSIGQAQTELVAFTYDIKRGSYVENVILKDACDIFFDVADIDKDGRFEIIAAGFFISKLNVIYSDAPNNNFLNGNAKVATIDTKAGKLFDVKIADLDKQGNLELLVTNHQGSKDSVKGSIYFYQLNGSIRNGTWLRNLIYNNFPVLKSGINQAAPGGAKLVQPDLNVDSRPYIILAGDGAEYAYLFQPSESGQLEYSLTWSYLFKGFTVGGISVADIDNDGYSELSIPAYEDNKIYIFTFSP